MTQKSEHKRLQLEEHHIYFLLMFLMVVAQFLPRFVLTESGDSQHLNGEMLGFGFNQLRHSAAIVIIGWYFLTILAISLYRRKPAGFIKIYEWLKLISRQRNFLWMLLISLGSAVIFFLLRSEYLNVDGSFFAEKFARDVPAFGAHVTHDEMWELYLHSRFWLYTQHFFGWTVEFSYQVVSSLAGGIFIFFLLLYSQQLLTYRRTAFCILMLSGAYMQLFFGDIENYTLTTVLILIYYLSAILYVKEKIPISVPSGLLAVAMTFHLLAGFLLPSLAFLFLIALKRKQYAQMMVGSAAFLLIILLTLWFFNQHNLPLRDLYYRSFAFGYGGEVRTLVRFSWNYLVERINLLSLLFPAFLILIPLTVYRRIRLEPFNLFLLSGAASMMLLFFIWESAIGIYDDWNLFANSAIILSILAWSNLLQAQLKYKTEILITLFSISALHTYSWILSNHFLYAS
jgi:hypothetical protein